MGFCGRMVFSTISTCKNIWKTVISRKHKNQQNYMKKLGLVGNVHDG
jgi:hypothetical protein